MESEHAISLRIKRVMCDPDHVLMLIQTVIQVEFDVVLYMGRRNGAAESSDPSMNVTDGLETSRDLTEGEFDSLRMRE